MRLAVVVDGTPVVDADGPELATLAAFTDPQLIHAEPRAVVVIFDPSRFALVDRWVIDNPWDDMPAEEVQPR